MLRRVVRGGFGRRRASGVGIILVIGLVVAFMPGKSGAVVTNSPSSFESNDGNMTVDTANNADWNCFANGKVSGFVASGVNVGAACSPALQTSSANVVVSHPGQTEATSAAGERAWKSGQKLDANCPAIVTKSSVPNKDDFTDIAQYNEEDSATPPNTYLYGAEIRAVANGNSSGNLELNQVAGTTACPINRTAGDKLIAFDFLSGGTSLSFHALTWITPANTTAGGNNGICDIGNDTPPCWGSNVLSSSPSLTVGGCNTAGTNDVEGCSNQSTITAANNGISGTALAVNQFAEFGVNLTKALQLTGCFPITQEVWESRSSGSSFTSNPEDIEILNHKINNCGEIKIVKHTSPRGESQSFGYSTSGGLNPSTFSLNDSAGSDGPANTEDYTAVPAGPYSVTENAEPSGFTFESLSCSADPNSGSSGTPSGETANITLKANGIVTCTYVNELNTAAISTVASSTTSVFPSQPVTDTATIAGNQPTETPGTNPVNFYLCGPLAAGGSCNSTNVSAGTGPLSGSDGMASATSGQVNTALDPLAPGFYCFEATWVGDNNYPTPLTDNGSAANHECFTVVQIGTGIVTSPQQNAVNITGNINFGSSVTDQALVTANQSGGGTPTGTVSFFICNPSQVSQGECQSGGAAAGSDSILTDNGTTSATYTSGSVTANQTGTWCFRSVYAPGGINGPNYTGSNDTGNATECFNVTDTTSSSSAQTWLPNDTAMLSSAHGAPLNGTLTVQMYTDASCGNAGGTAVSGQLYTDPLTNGASPVSFSTTNTTYTVSTSTAVSWLVTFTSSDTNVAPSSHCESTSLTINN